MRLGESRLEDLIDDEEYLQVLQEQWEKDAAMYEEIKRKMASVSNTNNSHASGVSNTNNLTPNAVSNTNNLHGENVSNTNKNRSRYMNEYQKTHYDLFQIRLPKGFKEAIRKENVSNTNTRNVSNTNIFLAGLAAVFGKEWVENVSNTNNSNQ